MAQAKKPVSTPAPEVAALIEALLRLDPAVRAAVWEGVQAASARKRGRGRPPSYAPAGGPLGHLLHTMAALHRADPDMKLHTLARRAVQTATPDELAHFSAEPKGLVANLVKIWKRESVEILRGYDPDVCMALELERTRADRLQLIAEIKAAGIDTEIPVTQAVRQLQLIRAAQKAADPRK